MKKHEHAFSRLVVSVRTSAPKCQRSGEVRGFLFFEWFVTSRSRFVGHEKSIVIMNADL